MPTANLCRMTDCRILWIGCRRAVESRFHSARRRLLDLVLFSAVGASISVAPPIFAGSANDEKFEESDEERSTLSGSAVALYLENDVLNDVDQHYTNGGKILFRTGDLRPGEEASLRRWVIGLLPAASNPDAVENFAFAVAQQIFTPADIEMTPPDPLDRPYAGWSYLEMSFAARNRFVMDSLSLQLGIVGPHSYAQDVQEYVHEFLGDAEPLGWDYQLEDEVGINVAYARTWRVAGRLGGNAFGIDLLPQIGASLGNVETYAKAGGLMRVGFNLPVDFGVDLLRGDGMAGVPTDSSDPRLGPNRGMSLFLFAGAEGRAVARNLFLDGNTFTDSPSVEKEAFVADIKYGVGLTWGRLQLTYSEVRRSREFEGQEQPSEFGSLAISCTW